MQNTNNPSLFSLGPNLQPLSLTLARRLFLVHTSLMFSLCTHNPYQVASLQEELEAERTRAQDTDALLDNAHATEEQLAEAQTRLAEVCVCV